MVQKMFNTGIALSGGGARGFAHAGVLKALNEAGIYPEVISGTSAGAIAGVLYADGYKPDEILEIMGSPRWLDFMKPSVGKTGLLEISGVQKKLKQCLRAKTFDELKYKLFVTATDFNNGQAVYFSSGDLVKCVIASASIPVLFKPVVIDNITYVDGGVLDNLPVKPLEKICRIKIGSYVNPTGPEKSFSNLIKIAERTFLLNLSREVISKKNKFDLLIAPSELIKYPLLDPEKSEEVFRIGYETTVRLLNSTDIVEKILSGIEKTGQPMNE
ncbi:MAG TPA: patatin-like phospholipase family protein [Bacteroidales bacterium]|nr:patatin-like phospholipase family protein [Bacteroidales bacterium]